MVTLKFEGWFQCRLATDPDPFDEPRGVSGIVKCLPGEPDFDRVIRFHDPKFTRSHTPHISVLITKVVNDNDEVFEHPLLNARFNLEQEPKFFGYNGIISDDALEPIVPFCISIKKENFHLERSIIDGKIEYPFNLSRPLDIMRGGNDIFEQTQIWNPESMLDDRISRLIADQSKTDDPIELYNINERINFLKQTNQDNYRTALERFPGRVSWMVKLKGKIRNDNNRYIQFHPSFPWIINFWMGCWDPDGMCGYVSGILQLRDAVLTKS